MKARLLILFFMSLHLTAFSTLQECDTIIFQGKKYELNFNLSPYNPLTNYYYLHRDLKYPFHSHSTSNWRGYIATWEINDDQQLYLTKIQNESKIYDLKKLYPDICIEGKVKADWFTGLLYLQKDRCIYWYDRSPDRKPCKESHYTTSYISVFEGYAMEQGIYDSTRTRIFYFNFKDKNNLSKSDSIKVIKYQEYLKKMSYIGEEETRKFLSTGSYNFYLKSNIDGLKDSIPLTTVCILKNAAFDENNKGELVENYIIESETKNLLIFEFNAHPIPTDIKWCNYDYRHFLLLVDIPDYNDFRNDIQNLKAANYTLCVGADVSGLNGILSLSKQNDSTVVIDGKFLFESGEIDLKGNKIPVMTVMQYLEKNRLKGPLGYIASEQMELIKKRTLLYNQNLYKRKKAKKH